MKTEIEMVVVSVPWFVKKLMVLEVYLFMAVNQWALEFVCYRLRVIHQSELYDWYDWMPYC